MERYYEALRYLQGHPEAVIVLGVLALAIVMALPWWKVDSEEWLDFIPRMKGRRMRRYRKNYVDQQAIDDFTHSVEERVYQGIYSREEAKELYRKLKHAFPIRDLFPNPELLKENIKKRRALQIHAPVPLPDSDIPPPPKHAFDKPKKKKSA